ncbi:MAG: hypothetical protein KGI24_08815 [Candidatus Omnitrophica bacterium]|nr:hypothetical protein [Candidatus Omnitrophota bacterium]
MNNGKEDTLLLAQAVKAMRKAVKNVIAERKLLGQPLIIWKDGKVVKIPASRLNRNNSF